MTRGHPTARFLNRMSAVFTPLKRQNAPRGAGKGCWGGLGGSMACCILGPPTLSTFPASMCSLRATWADEAISQVQKAGRKGQVRGSKGPSFLLAGSARRGFLAPRAKAHAGFSSRYSFLMPHDDCTGSRTNSISGDTFLPGTHLFRALGQGGTQQFRCFGMISSGS